MAVDKSNFPFTYSGNWRVTESGGWYKAYLTSSGTLTPTRNATIDAFLVGGASSGGSASGASSIGDSHLAGGGGGGGGYTTTQLNVGISIGTNISVTIGAGGVAPAEGYGYGAQTRFGSYTADGGMAGWGGSAGGSGATNDQADEDPHISGRTLGSTDGGGYTGQGRTTREFSEPSGILYSTGGDGGSTSDRNVPAAQPGAANTGDGGDGAHVTPTGGYNNLVPGENGGSGVVVLRIPANNPPTTPSTLEVSTPIVINSPITINWGASSDPDNNLKGYLLYRADNGSSTFATKYDGTGRTFTDTVVKGITLVQYRVRAYDAEGAYSDLRTSAVLPVDNTLPPTFVSGPWSGSDTDADLGQQNTDFSVTFSVTHPDEPYSIDLTYDGVDYPFSVSLPVGQPGTTTSYTLSFSGDEYLSILNGTHVIGVAAIANQSGKSDTRTITFSRNATTAEITLKEPIAPDPDTVISRVVMYVVGQIPDDSTFTVEVTNNAKDPAPYWQDGTLQIQRGRPIILQNMDIINGNWFNFRIRGVGGSSGELGYISEVYGNFGI